MAATADSKCPTQVLRCNRFGLFVLLTLCVGSKAAAIGGEPEKAEDAALYIQSQDAVVHQEIPHQPQHQDQQQQLNAHEQADPGQEGLLNEQQLNVHSAGQADFGAEAAGHQIPVDDQQQQHQVPVDDQQQQHQVPVDDPQQQHQVPVGDQQQQHQVPVDDPQQQHQVPVGDQQQQHQSDGSFEAGGHQASMDEPHQQQQLQADAGLQQNEGAAGDQSSQGGFHGGVVEDMVHGGDNVHDPSAQHDQAAAESEGEEFSDQEIGVMDVEHLLHDGQHDVHQQRSQEQPADPEGHQQQVQGGDVEQMVHGGSNVHDPSAHHQAEDNAQDEDGYPQAGVVDLEHIMHGEDYDVHAQSADAQEPAADEAAKGEFKAEDVERMMHGEGAGEGHVHGPDSPQQENQAGPFKVAVDIDQLGRDSINVHNPRSRDFIASVGDLSASMMGSVGEIGEEGEGKGGGSAPMVADSESLMHGAGGHDHDVRQLKFLKTKEQAQAKDPFQDLHELLMHGRSSDDGGDHGEGKIGRDADDHSLIRRGKKITYKDIMELGLDEASLRGVDLTKLLQENAREYDDWQRDTQAMEGEAPEKSFWEQIRELQKRYLSFGTRDGEAEDLTGTRLDPEKQRWVTEDDNEAEEGEGQRSGQGRGGADEGEDSVLHQMEVLGNTAAKQDRHKLQHNGNDHGSGREQGDL